MCKSCVGNDSVYLKINDLLQSTEKAVRSPYLHRQCTTVTYVSLPSMRACTRDIQAEHCALQRTVSARMDDRAIRCARIRHHGRLAKEYNRTNLAF